jgi:hypothetical protein
MNLLNLSAKEAQAQEQIREHGRVIARGIEDVKVEQQKNMAKADRRYNTMLERAAERALSGGVQRRRL